MLHRAGGGPRCRGPRGQRQEPRVPRAPARAARRVPPMLQAQARRAQTPPPRQPVACRGSGGVGEGLGRASPALRRRQAGDPISRHLCVPERHRRFTHPFRQPDNRHVLVERPGARQRQAQGDGCRGGVCLGCLPATSPVRAAPRTGCLTRARALDCQTLSAPCSAIPQRERVAFQTGCLMVLGPKAPPPKKPPILSPCCGAPMSLRSRLGRSWGFECRPP